MDESLLSPATPGTGRRRRLSRKYSVNSLRTDFLTRLPDKVRTHIDIESSSPFTIPSKSSESFTPDRLRSRRPPAQSTVTNNLQTPPSFEIDDEDELSISHELTKLIKVLQGTLRGSANTSQSDAGNPLFERDRGVYEEYSARRSERLKRKRGESGVEKQTPSKQCVGVRMESAKRTAEVKKYESARKMTTPSVERREVATAQRVERREPVTTQRYSLRSSSKVKKSFERSMDAATVERKTTVRRTARKGNPGTFEVDEEDELATGFHH